MKPFHVTNPCTETWDTMRPLGPSQAPGRDACARHCAACDRKVFDLAQLTATEIRGLLIVTQGDFCARQTAVAGALVVRPEPSALGRPTPHRALGALLAAGALQVAACATQPEVIANEAHPAPPSLCGSPSADTNTPNPAAPAPADAPAPTPAEPEPQYVKLGGMHEEVLDRIFFAHKDKAIEARARPVLEAVAAFLWKHSDRLLIGIVGHAAPNEGNEAATRKLSLARAESVRAFLIAQGIDARRLVAIGRSAEAASAENDGADARAVARVVTFQECATVDDCH